MVFEFVGPFLFASLYSSARPSLSSNRKMSLIIDLQEGVEKLSGGNDRCIPWKKILEYGGTVFQPGRRTAIDLKDKWRNMCKS